MEIEGKKDVKLEDKLEKELDNLDALLQEELDSKEKINIPVESKTETKEKQQTIESSEVIEKENIEPKVKTKEDIIKEYMQEANKYFKRRNFTEAIILYQKILELDNMNTAALFNLGVVYLEREEQELAQKKFEEVLEIKPDDYKSLCNLAGIYYKMGRLRDAYEILKKAIAINPNDINSLQNISLIEKKIMYSKAKKKK